MARISKTQTASTKTVAAPPTAKAIRVTAPKRPRARSIGVTVPTTIIADASLPAPESATTESSTIDSGPTPTPHAAPAFATKTAHLIAMLRSDPGASVTEIAAAFGWLPHTTRAALTGLRKRGHAIARSSMEGVTRYRIADGEVA